jgi:hypothetical protein
MGGFQERVVRHQPGEGLRRVVVPAVLPPVQYPLLNWIFVGVGVFI